MSDIKRIYRRVDERTRDCIEENPDLAETTRCVYCRLNSCMKCKFVAKKSSDPLDPRIRRLQRNLGFSPGEPLNAYNINQVILPRIYRFNLDDPNTMYSISPFDGRPYLPPQKFHITKFPGHTLTLQAKEKETAIPSADTRVGYSLNSHPIKRLPELSATLPNDKENVSTPRDSSDHQPMKKRPKLRTHIFKDLSALPVPAFFSYPQAIKTGPKLPGNKNNGGTSILLPGHSSSHLTTNKGLELLVNDAKKRGVKRNIPNNEKPASKKSETNSSTTFVSSAVFKYWGSQTKATKIPNEK